MGNGITRSVLSSTILTPSDAPTQSIDNLLAGDKWGGSIGTSVALTYSFTDYSSVFNYTTTGMTELKLMTDTQKTAMVNAMSAWANVANVTFSQVTETATSAGDIRISDTTSFAIPTINELTTPNTAQNGDIWIGANYGGYNDATAGSYTMDTFMHEIGHVLGLNHPSSSTIAAVSGEDQLKYSIMSYSSFNGDTAADYGNDFFPTTPMLNDIAAIQYLYGANMSYKTGNDIYTWSVGQKIFETIWDAGGNDTIDASNQSSAVTINLNSGQWSTIGGTFWNGQLYVNDYLTIAYGAVIENAAGTSLNDTLIGNQANNVLDGGAGIDTAVFSGNASEYTFYKNTDGSITVSDKMVGRDGTDTLLNIEQVMFVDTTIQTATIVNTTPSNTAPTSANVTMTINEDNSIVLSTTDFIFNDVDTGNTLAKVIITALPSVGSLTLNGVAVTLNHAIMVADITAGKLIFTPAANANGTEYSSFAFKVSDGTVYSVTDNTVTVNVTPVNDVPIITSDAIASIAENAPTTTVLYTALAMDVDAGTILSYTLSGSDAGLLNINSTTGEVTLKASANYEAKNNYSFNVIASDGAHSDTKAITATITNVNEAPTSANVTLTMNEDTEKVLALSDFTFNDVDTGDPLFKVIITTLPTVGSLKLNGTTLTANKEILASDISSGKLVFTPSANANGSRYASFGFKVSDGISYSLTENTVSFNVNAINDAAVGSVLMNGILAVGETLTASNTLSDVDGMDVIAYQWFVNDNKISGADTESYMLTSNELGKNITVSAHYTDGGGTIETVRSTSSSTILSAITNHGTSGADTLGGSSANDIFYVNNVNDQVIETSSGSNNHATVITTVDYTLTVNTVNLILAGSGDLRGDGNVLGNLLTGNDGSNILDAHKGDDTMQGGLGDDIYYIDSINDVVTEVANAGNDTVFSKISYTLTENVESLTLYSNASINGIGNTLDNIIIGTKGFNLLDGKGGNDTLIGGAGKDIFLFDTAVNGNTNVDTITDFMTGADKIELSHAIFSQLSIGNLNQANFVVSFNGEAVDSNDYLLYNTTTHTLLYDADGNGAGVAVAFANVGNINYTDMVIVA